MPYVASDKICVLAVMNTDPLLIERHRMTCYFLYCSFNEYNIFHGRYTNLVLIKKQTRFTKNTFIIPYTVNIILIILVKH